MPTKAERNAFIASRENQRRALALWGRKVSYPNIAKELACSGYAAHELVKRGLQNLDVPEAKERRAQDNMALDDLERVMWETVFNPGPMVTTSGKIVFAISEPDGTILRDEHGRAIPVLNLTARIEAARTILHISERRAKVNGSDAPVIVEQSITLELALRAADLLAEAASRKEREVVALRALPSPS